MKISIPNVGFYLDLNTNAWHHTNGKYATISAIRQVQECVSSYNCLLSTLAEYCVSIANNHLVLYDLILFLDVVLPFFIFSFSCLKKSFYLLFFQFLLCLFFFLSILSSFILLKFFSSPFYFFFKFFLFLQPFSLFDFFCSISFLFLYLSIHLFNFFHFVLFLLLLLFILFFYFSIHFFFVFLL